MSRCTPFSRESLPTYRTWGVPGQEVLEAPALPGSGLRSSCAGGGFGGSLAGLVEQLPRGPLIAGPGQNFDVHARWNHLDPVQQRPRPQDLTDGAADVVRAGDNRAGGGERGPGPVAQGLVAAHGELELGAVRLDHVGCPGGAPHRPTEQHVVGEHEVRRQRPADRSGVGLHELVELSARRYPDEARLHALVGVEHEHRQGAARCPGGQPGRPAGRAARVAPPGRPR